MKVERVVENLNRALHTVMEKDSSVYMIGEDIIDPYSGPFKATKGLSTLHPDRVITTPISECGMVGFALGLALCGDKPIVEIMFGDFIGYAFDQIWNVASKFVHMYGRKLDLNFLIRCTIGGNNGFGATHSQNPQKHFIGMTNLELFEITPFYDNTPMLENLLNRGNPVILFENKTLYPSYMYKNGHVNELFNYELIGEEKEFVRIYSDEMKHANTVIITPGGVVLRCLDAAKELFIEEELETQIIVPSKLYPFPIDGILDVLESAEHIFIVEEDTMGGTWGSEVAFNIHDRLWGSLRNRVHLVQSKNSIIPCSRHLEKKVVIQSEDIFKAIQSEV